MRSFVCFFLFLSVVLPANARDIFVTNVLSPRIKSLQIKVGDGLISDPMIVLGSDEQVEINFDSVEEGYTNYAYSIIHCDADWAASSLSPIEYMVGFQGMPVEDFANSLATTTSYTNYRFLLPNDDVRFRLSGNYAVRVYDEARPDETAFTACFYVAEPLVTIDTRISGMTDVDVNKGHQQLEFAINHRDYPIEHPLTDLKLHVYQNERRDNAVTGLNPASILPGRLVYSNNRNLIFKAGNEYRRIEFQSNKYNGMGVEEIRLFNPYYHVTLSPGHFRNTFSYQYDQDQNGRFFTQCSGCSDPDIEADYYIVHFALDEAEIPGGKVYLSGELVNNLFNNESLMDYNKERGRYEKFLLLKQGSYNYMYLFVPDKETIGQTAPIEGDFSETENEYTIAVYHRPIGLRYDRLIGFVKVSNRMTVF